MQLPKAQLYALLVTKTIRFLSSLFFRFIGLPSFLFIVSPWVILDPCDPGPPPPPTHVHKNQRPQGERYIPGWSFFASLVREVCNETTISYEDEALLQSLEFAPPTYPLKVVSRRSLSLMHIERKKIQREGREATIIYVLDGEGMGLWSHCHLTQ